MDFRSAFKLSNTNSKLTAGYHDFYQIMLAHEQIDSVLELGIYRGDSLRAWRIMWPSAIIEGGDYDFKFDKDLLNEFDIKQIDSTIREDADKFADQYDIIIDDAGHHWRNQTATYNNFYDKAKKFYILEDILGEYGLDKVKANLPSNAFDRATIFTSTGPGRNFKHSKHVEPNGKYKIIFFDKREI
jgi:hypothetical protein